MNHFSEELYRSALQDSFFADFHLIQSYDFQKLNFPIKNTVISFGSEKNDRMHFLLGYDIFESGDEKVVVTVLTGEKHGGAYCEQLAKDICMKILELDQNKNIISIAVERCMYDPNVFAYKIKMTFGIRESAVKTGKE